MASLLSFQMKSHSNHDSKWSIPRNGMEQLCLACIMEYIEDPEILVLKKKHAFVALLDLFQQSCQPIKQLLENEIIIAQHISYLFVGKIIGCLKNIALNVTEKAPYLIDFHWCIRRGMGLCR